MGQSFLTQKVIFLWISIFAFSFSINELKINLVKSSHIAYLIL